MDLENAGESNQAQRIESVAAASARNALRLSHVRFGGIKRRLEVRRETRQVRLFPFPSFPGLSSWRKRKSDLVSRDVEDEGTRKSKVSVMEIWMRPLRGTTAPGQYDPCWMRVDLDAED